MIRGHVVHLSRSIGKFTSMVDVVLEPYVWTYWNKDFGWNNRVGEMGILGSPTAGTYLPTRTCRRRGNWVAGWRGVRNTSGCFRGRHRRGPVRRSSTRSSGEILSIPVDE